MCTLSGFGKKRLQEDQYILSDENRSWPLLAFVSYIIGHLVSINVLDSEDKDVAIICWCDKIGGDISCWFESSWWSEGVDVGDWRRCLLTSSNYGWDNYFTMSTSHNCLSYSNSCYLSIWHCIILNYYYNIYH